MKIVLTTMLMVISATMATAQIKQDSTLVSVGYGSEDQHRLTGAVDQVTQERMKKGLVTNSIEALSGQAAGVEVQSGINQEAMLNAVRVRGTTSLTGGNDPLVIIDGVQSDITTLSTIYPADIESFTILKDASETAQYGSRGAAGVIQVVTKKGSGERFHIAYDGSIGFQSAYKTLGMLNAEQFRNAVQQLGKSVLDMGYDTDFNRAITQTGHVQNHHVAFGGGSQSANYRASIGLQDHSSIIRKNRYRNYIAKLDLTQRAFNDRLTFDLGVFGSLQKFDYIPFQQKLFYSASAFNPTFPAEKNANGSFDQVTEALWINNPNSLLEAQDDENNAHVNTHLKITANLGYGLKLMAFGSFSYMSVDNGHYYPTYVWNHGEAYRSHAKTEQQLGNLSLNWQRTFAKRHDVDLLALFEAESVSRKGFYTTVSGFSTDAFSYNNLSAGASKPWNGTSSFFTDTHMESFLFKAQYTYLNRYMLNVNARADGSSKVGVNNRWGFFPSISAAWVVSDEAWMKSLNWISRMKLRVGYGKSGNLGAIDSYMSRQLIKPNGIVNIYGAPVTTLGIIRNANPDLRWEVKRTFNAGIDLGFWNNRIVLKADFYGSRTSDMLYEYQVPVPPFTYPQLLANLGKMQNHGFEFGFGITPIRQKDLELSINMNWSFERNKLITLDGDYNGQHLTAPKVKGISGLYGAGYHGGSDVCFQMVGQPLGVFYLPHFLGFKENENGGKEYVKTTESYICGQATPKARMGSNIALRYRQWDITIQVNGAFGHKIYNGTSLTYMNMLSLPNYNVMQGAPEMNIQDQDISDYWLESGDYLNIDYVTVGWNIPLRSQYVRNLRVSCSVDNLATITGYNGLTPMINSSIVNNTLGVDDKRTFPLYRSYSVALSIQF